MTYSGFCVNKLISYLINLVSFTQHVKLYTTHLIIYSRGVITINDND